jgi:hypothetical protein
VCHRLTLLTLIKANYIQYIRWTLLDVQQYDHYDDDCVEGKSQGEVLRSGEDLKINWNF